MVTPLGGWVASLVCCPVGSSVNLIDYTAAVVKFLALKLTLGFAANKYIDVLLTYTFVKCSLQVFFYVFLAHVENLP